MNQIARLRRAYQSNGSSSGEHQRTRFAKYHHGAWYFTRDAKSGATSVRWANLMKLENGAPPGEPVVDADGYGDGNEVAGESHQYRCPS